RCPRRPKAKTGRTVSDRCAGPAWNDAASGGTTRVRRARPDARSRVGLLASCRLYQRGAGGGVRAVLRLLVPPSGAGVVRAVRHPTPFRSRPILGSHFVAVACTLRWHTSLSKRAKTPPTSPEAPPQTPQSRRPISHIGSRTARAARSMP